MRDIEIPDAQPKREDQAPQPTRGRVMRNPEMENQLGARSKKPNERKRKLDTLNRQDGKKPRRAMEVISLNTRSETAITKLRAHIKDGTCPKTLRYNVRANITRDEQFKKEIGSIRKNAEQEFIRSLAKFHQRRIEHLQSKRTKVEQELSREKTETNVFQTRKNRTPSAPRDENIHMSTGVLKLASNIQAKIDKFTQLLSKIDDSQNKQCESYPSVLYASKGGREKETKRNTLTIRNYKRRARKKNLQQKTSRETIELRKQHIKNLSDTQLTAEQINLLSRGLKFIPTPVMKENQIRRQLLSDFNQFARRMRLQYIYHDQNTEQHPFHVKSSWIPPIQRSVALETYLEEVKIKLAETPLVKPKNNLPPGEQRALKELINNKEIILKKADKVQQPSL